MNNPFKKPSFREGDSSSFSWKGMPWQKRLERGRGQGFGWGPEARMRQISGLQEKNLEEVAEK